MNCRMIQWEGDIDFLSAAGNGDTDAVERLLKQGSDMNTKDEEGKTALMYAAANGHVSTMRMLLEAGADVETKDNYGATASEFAECESYFDIVLLIEGIICPLCYKPAVEDNCCLHFLGSINDCGLSTPLEFDKYVSELSGLIQCLDDGEYESVISKAPLILRKLFKAARDNDDYWTNDKDVLTRQWKSRGINFLFHPNAQDFVNEIKKESDQGITWLKSHTSFY